ncbi:tetratricopeptide repeat protein [Methyloversatilis sp.]|uniref:tetratricopeptide repeat protein n=1 Tax=Methyloversatilis sp. TaxID=2569862 RepID=UPI0035B1F8DE
MSARLRFLCAAFATTVACGAAASEQWRTAHLRGECATALAEARGAAEKGEPEAMLQLSDWHFFGTCLAKDDVESARWALLAAEGGLARAQVVAGQIHASGLGVERDPAAARRWYEKAADAGDAEAMLLLARLMEADTADPLAPELARAWARRAAEKNYAPAFVHLAGLFSGGGPQTDYAEAARWLEKALQAGYKDNGVWVAWSWACLNLGRYDDVLQAVQQVPKDAPEFKAAQINQAHALLLNGQVGNAREVYAENMTLRGADEFRRILRDDFSELRRSGRAHPGMVRIEKLFLGGTP